MTFSEKARWINEKFQLNAYADQDWHIVNADSNKLDEFINFYLSTNNLQEVGMMFNLIIASLNEVESEETVKKQWNKIEEKVKDNQHLHLIELIYWSQMGEEVEEDSIFRNIDFFRRWLSNLISVSSFEISAPETNGIKIDGKRLTQLMNKSSLPIDFYLITDYLKKEVNHDDNCLSHDEQEGNIIKDYFFMIKRIFEKYTFLEISSMKSNLLFFKFKTDQFEAEINKYSS